MTAEGSLPAVTLVLGGARSGKSRFAEEAVLAMPGSHLYLATATAGDAEMAARIAEHKARRGTAWETVEEPLALAETLSQRMSDDTAILVDCLTLWLSNLMLAERPVEDAAAALVGVLKDACGAVVLVSNEVGQGIVPADATARLFRDHAGRLHQDIAAVAQKVVFVTAGLPQLLKEP
jgi:adenosylcobinamide kinase/adenosylcobinamide-phosphate guanylyltransferase